LRDVFADVVGISLSVIVSVYHNQGYLCSLRFDDVKELIHGVLLLGDTSINSRFPTRHRTSKGIYHEYSPLSR
jgi:hypothetical protein